MNHIALSGFLLSLPKIYGKSEADYDDLATNSVCKQADPISEEENREEGYSHGGCHEWQLLDRPIDGHHTNEWSQ